MIRRTCVVLDTPQDEHIHLFSVFEEINKDMQDAGRRDRHARAHHYNLNTGLGDIQVYIENLNGVNLSQVESSLSDYLVADNKGLTILNSGFGKEPSGEGQSMILDTGTEMVSTVNKVLPIRRGVRKVRAYVDIDKVTKKYIEQDDKTVRHLEEVTEKVLGFNLANYSEHIGNIYVVEDFSPVKGIDVSGMTDPCGLLCTIEYREPNWKEEFTIQVRDRHHKDIAVWDKIYDIPGGARTVILEMPQAPAGVEIYAYDKQHNIIYYHPYTPFVRNIHFEMGVQSKVLRVKGKNKNGDETVVDYPKFAHEKPTIISDKSGRYIDGDFKEAKPLQQVTIEDNGLRFCFFDTDAEHQDDYVRKAQNVLQRIIDQARAECYICDPYFNAGDFERFIYPLKSLNVNVKILNGKEQMKKKREEDEKERDRIKELKAVLQQYNDKIKGQPIQCRMLTGRGQLHDRFILIENRGWVLGASFTEFGNRVTTINEIPSKYLNSIKNRIVEWWYSDVATMSIEDYDDRNDAGSNTDSDINAASSDEQQ